MTSAAHLGVPHVHLVTIPGDVFFMPNEIPDRIGDIIIKAVAAAD
jgi:hypothetical protein